MHTLRVIKYQPELNEVTGGITATIVMGQLEYWFHKTEGKPFYKFLAPCEDESYRVGDSWCEELGFSRNEFRTAFGAIGKVYKTKKAYIESKDKFEGKLYLSYYDRIRRRTYYMRNDVLLEQLGQVLCKGEKQKPTNKEIQSPITEDYARDLHTKNTAEDDADKGQKVYEEVISLYHEVCEELPKVMMITKKRQGMIDQFLENCKEGMAQIKQVFEKVQASDFLCGRDTKSTWRAQFDWIMNRENREAILAGKYDTWHKAGGGNVSPVVEVPPFGESDGERSYPAMRSVKGKNTFTTTYTHSWNHEELEAMAYDYFESL
ncbi:MAG: hypothetical protein ACRCW2_04790 [Cellulosilyticaceae bacterium]